MKDFYLTEKEAQKFFFDRGKINRQELTEQSALVSNEMELVIFTFNPNLGLKILNLLMVQEFRVSNLGGLMIPVLDKRAYKTLHVTTVPKKVRGYDIVFNVPVTATVRRTLKQLTSGRVLNGTSATLEWRQRFLEADRVPGSDYCLPVGKFYTVFGKEEINRAFEKLEEGK